MAQATGSSLCHSVEDKHQRDYHDSPSDLDPLWDSQKVLKHQEHLSIPAREREERRGEGENEGEKKTAQGNGCKLQIKVKTNDPVVNVLRACNCF